MRAFTLQANRRILTASVLMGFVLLAMGSLYHFCPCQEVRPSLTEEDIKCGSRRRELDELLRGYIQEKGFTVIEMWECEWLRLYKTNFNVKLHILSLQAFTCS